MEYEEQAYHNIPPWAVVPCILLFEHCHEAYRCSCLPCPSSFQRKGHMSHLFRRGQLLFSCSVGLFCSVFLFQLGVSKHWKRLCIIKPFFPLYCSLVIAEEIALSQKKADINSQTGKIIISRDAMLLLHYNSTLTQTRAHYKSPEVMPSAQKGSLTQ